MRHDKIGEFIAEKWKLPPDIVLSLGRHHNPPPLSEGQSEPRLVDFVHAADVFIKIRNIGSSGDKKVPRLMQHVWHVLQLKPEGLQDLYKELDEEVEKAKQFLEMAKG